MARQGGACYRTRRLPSPHALDVFLSAIAGIGEILPLFLVLEIVLLLVGRRDLAGRWGAGFVVCLLGTYLLKWLDQQLSYPPMFPSGHVSMAVYAFGGLAFLLLGRGKARERLGWIALGAIGIAEGISRLRLTEHNWFDVTGGIALGIVCLPLVGCPAKWRELPLAARAALAVAFCVALVPVSIYGPRLDLLLHRYAAY